MKLRSEFLLLVMLLVAVSLVVVEFGAYFIAYLLMSFAFIVQGIFYYAYQRREPVRLRQARIEQVIADARFVWGLRHTQTDGRPMFDQSTLASVRNALNSVADSMESWLGHVK